MSAFRFLRLEAVDHIFNRHGLETGDAGLLLTFDDHGAPGRVFVPLPGESFPWTSATWSELGEVLTVGITKQRAQTQAPELSATNRKDSTHG